MHGGAAPSACWGRDETPAPAQGERWGREHSGTRQKKFGNCQRQMVSLNPIDVWQFNLFLIRKHKQQLKGTHGDTRARGPRILPHPADLPRRGTDGRRDGRQDAAVPGAGTHTPPASPASDLGLALGRNQAQSHSRTIQNPQNHRVAPCDAQIPLRCAPAESFSPTLSQQTRCSGGFWDRKVASAAPKAPCVTAASRVPWR